MTTIPGQSTITPLIASDNASLSSTESANTDAAVIGSVRQADRVTLASSERQDSCMREAISVAYNTIQVASLGSLAFVGSGALAGYMAGGKDGAAIGAKMGATFGGSFSFICVVLAGLTMRCHCNQQAKVHAVSENVSPDHTYHDTDQPSEHSEIVRGLELSYV